MKLLGLIGKKKSGKTTVANIISELLPKKVVPIIGFADALKKEVAYMLLSTTSPEFVEHANQMDIEVEVNNTLAEIEKNKDNYRLLLQWWGTNFRREMYGSHYWIDKVELEIISHYSDEELVIIPDVRFLNEAAMITRLGGSLVRIYRTGEEILMDRHSSETELSTISENFFLDNSSDLEELKIKTKALMYKMKLL